MFKPWVMGFVRYEQVKIFNSGLEAYTTAADGTLISGGEQARVVPGLLSRSARTCTCRARCTSTYAACPGHGLPGIDLPVDYDY